MKAINLVRTLIPEVGKQYATPPKDYPGSHFTSDKQSIPDGTKVRFSTKDIGPREFGDEESARVAGEHEGQTATVLTLATATELGEKDYEYYDIRFDDGVELAAISGYHLDPVGVTEVKMYATPSKPYPGSRFTGTKSVELDIADEECDDIESCKARTQKWASKFGKIRAVLVDPEGPGGGWPVFRFTGPEDALRKLLVDYTGDEAEADDLLSSSE